MIQEDRTGKARLSVGETLTCVSQNFCGMPEALSWQLCFGEGHDVVLLQETRGAEQKKQTWPKGRFFHGSQPPDNDPASGVAIALSERMARCVAPGGVIRGRKFPSRILLVRLKCVGIDLVFGSVYVPHDGRTNPSQQEVLDDLTDTCERAYGSQRICLVLGTDANAQLARSVPFRTGKWCVREAGNKQGERVLGMMDSLDLFAASTGNSSKPRYRGGAASYSVQEKTSARDEKRVQLDYVLISAVFRSWFLGSHSTWRYCLKRRGDRSDHKGICFRVRVRLRRGRPNSGRRWRNLRLCGEKGREQFSSTYLRTSAAMRTRGAAEWRSSGFREPQQGFDLEQHCFGEKMAAARQGPIPGGLTADDVPQLAAPQPDPDIAVTPEPPAADLSAASTATTTGAG